MTLSEVIGLVAVIVVSPVAVGDAICTTVTTLVPCELSVYVADAMAGLNGMLMFVVRDEDSCADFNVMAGAPTLPEGDVIGVEFVDDAFVMDVAWLEVRAAAWADIVVSVSRIVSVNKG